MADVVESGTKLECFSEDSSSSYVSALGDDTEADPIYRPIKKGPMKGDQKCCSDEEFKVGKKMSTKTVASSQASVVNNNQPGIQPKTVITKQMEEEERNITKENAKEEQRVLEQMKEELAEQDELEQQAKYKRLMHLLNQSQFYSNFLWKKIEDSKARELKKKQIKKKNEENNMSEAPRSLKEINANTVSSPSRPKRNAKKRSLLTDYIDTDAINKAKKRRLESDDILKDDILIKQEPAEESAKTHINALGLEVPEGQPELLEGGVLRPYQLQGLNWLKALFENGVNGILADEMGLGKTIQVISLLCHLVENGITGPFLIIAPLSTLPNWMMEFEKFAPLLPTVLFHGSKTERPKMYKKLKMKVKVNEKMSIAPIVLTSYQMAVIEQQFMKTFHWRYVIVDEGHALKNENAVISRTLRSFHSVNRLLLTGTPLQNNLRELWALLNFLLPEVFDDLKMFQALFDIEAITSSDSTSSFLQKEAESHVLSTLHKVLTPFLLRRLKTDVELYLPIKKEILVFCPLTDLQLHLYKATIDNVIESLLKAEQDDISSSPDGPRKKRKCAEMKRDYTFKDIDWFGNKPKPEPVVEEKPDPKDAIEDAWHISLKMANPEMQLRKIANHPYLVKMPVEMEGDGKVMVSSEDLVNCSGKMLALNAMLLKLHQAGHKVLIFSFFKVMLNLIEEFAVIRGYRYVRLDGSTGIEDRKANIRAFNTDPDIFLFMITTRAGGLGLNLTAADTVIIFDSDYNPQVDLQAMDRCHRIGQKKPVMIYRFISKGTVDEKILETASKKRKLDKIVIKKDLFKMTGPTKKLYGDLEELKQLLESADHCKVVHSNGLVFTNEELDELLDRSSDNVENKGSHFEVVSSAGTSVQPMKLENDANPSSSNGTT